MIDPFKIDGPTCISFSGGRTSAYMLWRVLHSNGGLPAEAVVCFANTGKEDEATLAFVQECSERWSVPIAWLEFVSRAANGFRVVNFETASRNGEPFERLIDTKQFLPNIVMRSCTEELKVRTMHRYMASLGYDDHDEMIGFRADEPRRVVKMRGRARLPLAESGVTQADVQAFWRASTFDLGLERRDGITIGGQCDLCFLLPLPYILARVREKPTRAVWWARQEDRTGGFFSKDRPRYGAMQRFAENQADAFGYDNEEAIPCFCGD